MIVLPDSRESRLLLSLPWHLWPSLALARWAQREPIVLAMRRVEMMRPPLRVAVGAEA